MKTENPTTSAFAWTGGLETTVKMVGNARVLKFPEGGHASITYDLYKMCSALPTELHVSIQLGTNHYVS